MRREKHSCGRYQTTCRIYTKVNAVFGVKIYVFYEKLTNNHLEKQGVAYHKNENNLWTTQGYQMNLNKKITISHQGGLAHGLMNKGHTSYSTMGHTHGTMNTSPTIK